MKLNSKFFCFGFLIVALATAFCLPTLWPQLTGKNTDYDPEGLALFVSVLVAGNLGFLIAALWARRKEAAVKSTAGEPGPNLGSKPGEPDAFVRLDFTRNFPHTFWVSSVSYDSESPDGFLYKLFAIRREPDMVIDLLLLRETVDGPKRQVFHMQAPIDKLGTVDDVIRQIEQDSNVAFERFDLSDVRTLAEFRSRAIAAGWESAHAE